MKQFLPLALGLTATYGVATMNWVAPAQAEDEPTTATDMAQTEMPVDVTPDSTARQTDAIALSFEPPQPTAVTAQPVESAVSAPAEAPPTEPVTATGKGGASREDLFAGGSESVVARTVGAAEGTRSPDGGKTDIYEGHVDPGNGVWNRGTFSYQFGNNENLSAEEADRRQMAKIKRIYDSVMLPKAEQHGVAPLTLAEELNGIDLINQAPLTVTEDGGYIERLAEAKTKKGLSGQEAILEARIWSFWDPSRGGWDAPGLRAYDDLGKEASIRHDQKRRMGMIDEALAAYQQENGAIAARPANPPTSDQPTDPGDRNQLANRTGSPTPLAGSATPSEQMEQRANQIIFGSPNATGVPIAMMSTGKGTLQ